ELRYNVKRMWSKCGLRDVLPHSNGVFLFKFAKNEGLQFVLENGLWLINDKPLLVQKWQHDICLDKKELSRLPSWVKLLNVPLEAWTHRGISALASGVGKPIIMDATSIEICHSGKEVEVVYRNAEKKETIVKHVAIEYSWKPALCKTCGVFGHNDNSCKNRQSLHEGIKQKVEGSDAEKRTNGNNNEGFVEVHYKRKSVNQRNYNQEQDSMELSILKVREEVDKYLLKRYHPPLSVFNNRSHDMLKYFREKWEEFDGMRNRKDVIEVEDVFEDTSPTAKMMALNNMECLAEEGEKTKRGKSSNQGRKPSESNSMHSRKGCKIIVSWNDPELRDVVKDKQRLLDRDPHNGILKNDMVKTLLEYQDAMLDEKKLLYQKTKIKWFKEGDHNTAFFHRVIKGITNKSRIEAVCNDKGERVEGKMVREMTDNEIKDGMFNIGDNKAPGTDGFTSTCFKKHGGIVGNDVCKAIKEFFTNGKLLGEVNATVISLVLKIPTHNKVTDYRPIACCNVMYKCISKVLTNRIKDALNKLMNKNQSSFIPSRLIQDNIMLVQELLMGYNRKSEGKRVAFKIDIQKAYDTVSWNFLEEALK
ncbi:RNA-directed DNA polymerase, eukaryota, reverse transcriptase zinc-binding domain protein, partial [Tanacetum coccineum]